MEDSDDGSNDGSEVHATLVTDHPPSRYVLNTKDGPLDVDMHFPDHLNNSNDTSCRSDPLT